MKAILQINASIHSAGGQSSQLADQLVARLREKNPGAALTLRDLARDPVPHLDAGRFGAFIAPKEKRSPEQQAIVKFSDALVEELKRADVLVLALPMYNFGVPSQLKAWIDHVARAGVTFRYTDKGPAGLLTGKKAYVIATRGGTYAGTPADHETPYVRQLLGFLGIDEIEFVYAEGLALGDGPRNDSLARARAAIARLGGEALLAA